LKRKFLFSHRSRYFATIYLKDDQEIAETKDVVGILVLACLLLVSAGLPATTSTFELAALGADEGLDVRAGCSSSAKVSASQTVGTLTLEHQGILAGGSAESQLIQSQDFTSWKR
jgi:hypothetical protein